MVAVALAVAAMLWLRSRDVFLPIAGGDGVSMPSASPDEQGLDASALESAAQTARSLGASAFLVARRGHRVFEWTRSDELIAAPLVARLARGVAAVVGPEEGSVADAVWRPLSAGPARVAVDRDGEPKWDCCFQFRPRDGLAVVTALAEGGVVGGVRLLPIDPARHILDQLDDHVAARGDEPFGARAGRIWRDAEGSRLYVFPTQSIVILMLGADEQKLRDETALAHQVLRGIVDSSGRPPAPATGSQPPHP
jgi:hypothetical protein